MGTTQLRNRRLSGGGRNPEWHPCVYLLASRRNGTWYVGVTSNFTQRVWQHKGDLTQGFTQRYGVHSLVWYEGHETMESAIALYFNNLSDKFGMTHVHLESPTQ